VLREAKYLGKLPFRGRGEGDLERLVGGIAAEIDARLLHKRPARILELGCGYGTALLDLRARYGERVQLHGINAAGDAANAEVLALSAAARGLDAALPQVVCTDVAHGLPFPDEHFDVVYSQVAWLYFGNKIGVLQEVLRVLCQDGIAKIDADELRQGLPPEYCRLVEIWDQGRLLPFGEYLRGFGLDLVAAPEGEYVRLHKCEGLGADLELVAQIDLACLHLHWDGIKCIYRRR
jgi:SAM-dependent methyltransferase